MLLQDPIRLSLIVFTIIFVSAGVYHRIQSQRSGERLDHKREGWPLLIGIRLFAILTLAGTLIGIWNPALMEWASWPVSNGVRWVGVFAYACSVAWLIWMFQSLGRNLTDTVSTRQEAYFVESGPYRFVRNPMYTGVLAIGFSLGPALETWLVPAGASIVFSLLALRTPIEERYLVQRFGERYLDYMRRVGRFLPRLN